MQDVPDHQDTPARPSRAEILCNGLRTLPVRSCTIPGSSVTRVVRAAAERAGTPGSWQARWHALTWWFPT